LDTLVQLLEMVLHIDKHLGVFIDQYGNWVYLFLFLIVFVETGLVLFPFLPGDSLLFIGGAFAATGAMDPWLLGVLLFIAAVFSIAMPFARPTTSTNTTAARRS
jgi:membrane-associated protein